MSPTLIAVFFQFFPILIYFSVGLAFGSFLNVCILRIPAGQSIVHPRSRCPRCKRPLRWRDNIPLVSFIMLGGRCRNCRKPISWQYPVVEALTGALFVLAFLKFYGPSFQLAVVEFLVVASILISGIDIWTYTIPDKIVLPFLVIAVCLAPLNSLLGEQWLKRLSAGFAGILIGGGVLFFLGWVGAKIFGKEAMGGGDIKLLAAFGAFLGWEKVLDGLFLGSLICALLGLVLLLSGQLKPKSPLPFGPFLCAGCLLALFFEKLRLIVWFWG